MVTRAFRAWRTAGQPWRDARPIRAVGDRLREHGYAVYYHGNDAHLTAELPEDHTPFSGTGWPGPHPYPYCLAADVMPPKPGQKSKLDGLPLPSLQQLGRALRADKIADHPGARWLKYMNWEPEGNYRGPCWHDSWQPAYARRSSTDRGHIHLSGRTDYVTSATADGYDLVARARGEGEDDMFETAKVPIRHKGPLEEWSAAGALGHAVDTAEQIQAELGKQFAAVRLAQGAILAAVQGVNEEAVLARVDQLAAESAARHLELRQQVAAMPQQVLAVLPAGSDPVTRDELASALQQVITRAVAALATAPPA